MLVLVVLILLVAAPIPAQETPRDAQGWVDLSQWDVTTDGPVRLVGTWDFFWRELVPPSGEALGTPVPITVPRFWHRTRVAGDSGATAGRGYGTYRLRVRLPPDPPPLALRLGNINTAAAVYAQGHLVWRAGRATDDPRTAIPGYRPGVALLPELDTPVLELIVHDSSFEAARGALDDPVWLGPQDTLIAQRAQVLTWQSLLVGGLLIMGLYHLILFALRSRARISLYFSLVCFSAVGRLGLSDELLLLELWPHMPWPLLVRGMYFFAFSIFGAFTLYLQALWPRTAPKWFYHGLAAVAFGAGAVVLVTPVTVFTRGLVFLEVFVVASLITSVYIFARAMQLREAGRWIYAAGFVFVAAGALHDVVVSQGLLARALYLGPVGVFVFLLAQSAILAQRFARSLTTVERQRGELQGLVDRLERERRERQRYEELSLAASGLAHETKNPLGIIRGLAQRLSTAPDAAASTRHRAGQILDQADRAASRLGEFLSYARLRDPKTDAVDLPTLLRYATDVMSMDLEAKEIPCRVDVDPVTVVADEEMLLQIVLNLMLNSIAASRAGDALVLRFETDDDGQRGLLTVIDHGDGIPSDMLESVRKPYVSGRPDGHGLGLALVERLAELHGWRLHIESRHGEGTRVEIDGLEIVADGSA